MKTLKYSDSKNLFLMVFYFLTASMLLSGCEHANVKDQANNAGKFKPGIESFIYSPDFNLKQTKEKNPRIVASGPATFGVPFWRLVDISPDGKYLINEELRIFDLKKEKYIKNIDRQKICDNSKNASVHKVFFMSANLIAVRCDYELVVIYDFKTDSVIQKFRDALDFEISDSRSAIAILQKKDTTKHISYNHRNYAITKYSAPENKSFYIEIGNRINTPGIAISKAGDKFFVKDVFGDLGQNSEFYELDSLAGKKGYVIETKNSFGRPVYISDRPRVCEGRYMGLCPTYISPSGKWLVFYGNTSYGYSDNYQRAVLKNSESGETKVIKFPYCISSISSASISQDDKFITLGAVRNDSCFQNYSDTAQPIWSIETGEELIKKSEHSRREKMMNKATGASKNYNEAQRRIEQERSNASSGYSSYSSSSYQCTFKCAKDGINGRVSTSSYSLNVESTSPDSARSALRDKGVSVCSRSFEPGSSPWNVNCVKN